MKNILISTSLAVIVVLILACGFSFGVDWVQGSVMPEEVEKQIIITVPTYVEKPYYQEIEKLVYIDRPVYEVIEIPIVEEVIKWRNIHPKQFESLEQFIEWYEDQGFTVLFPSGAYTVDCDDYAELVQRKALEQGYAISQALTLNGNYYGTRVNENAGGHVGNIVLIDNTYYYFEPNPEKFYIEKIIERD